MANFRNKSERNDKKIKIDRHDLLDRIDRNSPRLRMHGLYGLAEASIYALSTIYSISCDVYRIDD